MRKNFFESNSYFIDEKVNILDFENCYKVYDEKGDSIGSIKQNLSKLQVLRTLVFDKRMLPFVLEIKNSDGQLEASISRGWTFWMPKITIKNAEGIAIGTIKQKFNLFQPTFKLFNTEEVLVGEIKGDLLAWNFKICDASNKEIGTISKKWAGVFKEIFTSADKYNVKMDSNYSNMGNRMLILSCAITIDMVLKERK